MRRCWPAPSEVAERHDVLAVAVEHRTGHLEVGDLAVVVAVGAVHRGEALAACTELIDVIKAAGADLEGTGVRLRPVRAGSACRDDADQTWTAFVSAGLFVAMAIVLAVLPVPFVAWSPGGTENTLGSVKGQPIISIEGITTYPTTGRLDLTIVSGTAADSRLTLAGGAGGVLVARIGTHCRGTRSTRRASRPTRSSGPRPR